MRKATIFIVVSLLLVLCGTPVLANGILPLPHAFYGNVTINGSPAPTGTTVEARGAGVLTGIKDNPITTTESGKFGKAGALEPKLIVQGDILDGAEISFYVNGHLATTEPATVEWHSGETTEVDLSATISGGGGPGGGGPGGGAGPTIDVTIDGQTTPYDISDEGEILETVNVTSADGKLTITIPEGTIALDKNDDPLESLTADVDESPPDPPEDAYIIGLAYDFGPDGATFDPPITFEYTYDPDDLPEGVAEEDLVLAWYNEDTGGWVELTCTVDTENNTITALVSHFTTFAIICGVKPAAFSLNSLAISPTEVAPGEKVNISVSVANTGGTEGSHSVVLKINGVKEAEKSITVAPGKSQDVSFTVTREEAANYSVVVDGLSGSFTVVAQAPPPPPEEVPPAKAPINWPVIGGIIAGVVIVGLLIFFLIRRRAA